MPVPDDEKFPLHDLFIIPLIAVVTIIILSGLGEILARYTFQENGRETCGIPDSIPMRMKPNCVSYRKAAEGPVTEMAYNDCGYRTKESCSLLPINRFRIALLGASTASGFKVPFDDTVGQRISVALAQACGHSVEVQNMSVPGYELVDAYSRMDEALAMKPHVVMFLFGSYDIEPISDPDRLKNRDNPEFLRQQENKSTIQGTRPRSAFAQLVDMTVNSRALLMVQHFLYTDRETFLRLFMLYGDKADYVRMPLSPMWEKRLSIANMLLADMARKVHSAGIPFVVIYAPNQLQVALLNADPKPESIDPYAIGKRFVTTAMQNNFVFVDTLGDFSAMTTPASVFYPVDGHLNSAGHAILASSAVRHLTDATVAPLTGCKSLSGATAN